MKPHKEKNNEIYRSYECNRPTTSSTSNPQLRTFRFSQNVILQPSLHDTLCVWPLQLHTYIIVDGLPRDHPGSYWSPGRHGHYSYKLASQTSNWKCIQCTRRPSTFDKLSAIHQICIAKVHDRDRHESFVVAIFSSDAPMLFCKHFKSRI